MEIEKLNEEILRSAPILEEFSTTSIVAGKTYVVSGTTSVPNINFGCGINMM